MNWSQPRAQNTLNIIHNKSTVWSVLTLLGLIYLSSVPPAYAQTVTKGLQSGDELGPLPSGQTVTFLDSFTEPQVGLSEVWLTMRFVAPRIAPGGDVDFDSASSDLDALCEGPGRQESARMAAQNAPADQVIIALLDQPTPRGEINHDATSYYGAYLPLETGCIWQ